MELLDHFYKPNAFDDHTFVFDEKQGAFNTMLALPKDGSGGTARLDRAPKAAKRAAGLA